MILLQNPNEPVPTNPIEIDAAIVDMQSKLSNNISWLTQAYGRAYRNIDLSTGERIYFPEIYLGEQNNSYRYLNVTPDNDKTGQCFFFVQQENISEFSIGQNSLLTYNVAIIFSVNLKLINETLLSTEIYTQRLISEVRDYLTRRLMPTSYILTLQNVLTRFEQVFSEFNITEDKGKNHAPLQHFRVNCTIQMREACPAPQTVVGVNSPPEANKVLWLKADAGVNGGAAEDSDFVYIWEDQSGNTHHFSQLTFNNQPQYRKNIAGTKPALFFNFDNLLLQSTQLFTAQDFSVYVVSQQLVQDQQNGSPLALSVAGFTTGSNRFYLRLGKDGSVTPRFSTVGANEISLGDRNSDINVDHAVRSGSSIDGYRNNVLKGTINYGNILSDLTHYIGNWNNNRLIGYVFEIIVYNVAHNTAEQEQAVKYLQTKYSLI